MTDQITQQVIRWYYPVWNMFSTLLVELCEHMLYGLFGLVFGALIGGIVLAAAVLVLGVEL